MAKKQAPPKIIIEHLVKSFDGNMVLKDINLQVEAGQSLCIIGTSGCGKSVTLKCLLGLIKPTSGSIRVDGLEMVGQSVPSARKPFKIWHDLSIWRII